MDLDLIDICDPGEKYDVHCFQRDFYATFFDLQQRQRLPILCGGTGMYIDAVTRDYTLPDVPVNQALREDLQDKTLTELKTILAQIKILHNRSDTESRERVLRAIEIATHCQSQPQGQSTAPEIHPCFLGLQLDAELGRQRIAQRLHQRLEAGLIMEVEGLLQHGLKPEALIYYGLEYKFVSSLHLSQG